METVSQFGRFIENGACFEAHATPARRWMNVHHTDYATSPDDREFYSLISQYGDGLIQFRAADGTTVFLCNFESNGLYIRDDETNHAFSPGGCPLPTPVEDLRVRYRAESTEISSRANDLAVTQRIFVPRREPVQIWTVTLKNLSDRPRELSVFAAAKFDLGGGCSVDVHPDLGGVFAWRYNSKEPDTLRRGFLCVQQPQLFADTTARREDFLTPAFSFAAPRLVTGHNLSGLSAREFHAVGATRARVSLAPGATARVDFLLGHAPSVEAAAALRATLTPAAIDARLAEVAAHQHRLAEAFTVDTGHPNLDALINHFAKKQVNAYLVNKSGYRDNVQVCYTLGMADEALAETALLRAISAQYAAGWAPHCFRPVSSKQCCDGHVWLFAAIPWHIQQTGDFSFLEKKVRWLDDAEPATVWEHLRRALAWTIKDTRVHGLCDLRAGDWNDGLSPRGDTGGRESVMVTQQLCHGLLEVAALAERIGETTYAAECRAHHAEFARRINEHAWDGEWYKRVLCDDGFALGSHTAEEGKIFINTQSWAILGQVAPPERAAQCMDSLEKLLGLDIGYRTVWPPFSKFNSRVGGSSTVFPGNIENGSSYNHAVGFKAVADCVLGRPEHAWDTFRKIAPDNPDNPITRSKMEPFAFSNKFYADDYNYGETLYAWNTGTGAWFTMLLVEYILGVRRDYDGLRIAPCLTKRVPRARIIRRFRGATFDIRLDNTAGRCTGLTSLTINGQPVSGDQLPDLREGVHVVEAVI